MLIDFTFHNPTKIYFGKNSLDFLKDELKNYGKNILLVYGKNSIKKYGLYDKITNILKECDKNVVELSGVKSNPTYAQLEEGCRLVRENNIDLILAVGGGSVIDCAKGVSVSAYCEEDPWQKYWMEAKPVDNKIVPIASILTMVGTASEMNAGSVITKEDVKIKAGRVFDSNVNPKFSILNPEFTYTVPYNQMVSGIYDIMCHLFEQYFSGNDDNTSDYVIEGLLESLIHSARIAIKEPINYEARSNIMWTSTMALNYIAGVSKTQDWEVHMIEHQVGAYTDCPHGIGLAIVSIPYYKHIYKYGTDKFARFATKVLKVSPDNKLKEEIALEGIEKLSEIIKEFNIPTTLKEIGATEEMLPLIANSTTLNSGGYKQLTKEEVLEILQECFE